MKLRLVWWKSYPPGQSLWVPFLIILCDLKILKQMMFLKVDYLCIDSQTFGQEIQVFKAQV